MHIIIILQNNADFSISLLFQFPIFGLSNDISRGPMGASTTGDESGNID